MKIIPIEVRTNRMNAKKHFREIVDLRVIYSQHLSRNEISSLNYLNVKNNFMHPLFWKENTQNQPQVHCYSEDSCNVITCNGVL